jgi:hypothetical protein
VQVDQYPPLTASRSRDGGRPPPCTLRLGCPDCWVTLRNRIFSALATAATCPPPPTCLFFQAGSSRTCTSHLCSAGNRGILSPLFESISPAVVKTPATSFLSGPLVLGFGDSLGEHRLEGWVLRFYCEQSPDFAAIPRKCPAHPRSGQIDGQLQLQLQCAGEFGTVGGRSTRRRWRGYRTKSVETERHRKLSKIYSPNIVTGHADAAKHHI